MRTEAFIFGSVALSLMTGAAHAAGPTQAELNNAANDSANWPYVDHDYRGQRYAPLDQITANNAADLTQVCSYTFPDRSPRRQWTARPVKSCGRGRQRPLTFH